MPSRLLAIVAIDRIVAADIDQIELAIFAAQDNPDAETYSDRAVITVL